MEDGAPFFFSLGGATAGGMGEVAGLASGVAVGEGDSVGVFAGVGVGDAEPFFRAVDFFAGWSFSSSSEPGFGFFLAGGDAPAFGLGEALFSGAGEDFFSSSDDSTIFFFFFRCGVGVGVGFSACLIFSPNDSSARAIEASGNAKARAMRQRRSPALITIERRWLIIGPIPAAPLC